MDMLTAKSIDRHPFASMVNMLLLMEKQYTVVLRRVSRPYDFLLSS